MDQITALRRRVEQLENELAANRSGEKQPQPLQRIRDLLRQNAAEKELEWALENENSDDPGKAAAARITLATRQ